LVPVVVLDNCKHLLTVCATLTETILARCPRVTILAASTHHLDRRKNIFTACHRSPCGKCNQRGHWQHESGRLLFPTFPDEIRQFLLTRIGTNDNLRTHSLNIFGVMLLALY
jgi:hypothetical protein